MVLSAAGGNCPLGMQRRVSLSLLCPDRGGNGYYSDFFLGAWSPDAALDVECSAPHCAVSSAASGRWYLLSPISPLHAPARRLVHEAPPDSTELAALAFRGYLLDPPVHGWCDSNPILDYWARRPESHNGIFAAARILHGNRLELVTDAFGIAPLYYRVWNGVALFSTDARLLSAGGDSFDLLPGRTFIQANSAFGDRTFVAGVRRVPPGHRLLFEGTTAPVSRKWFRYEDLPPGDQPIDDAAVRKVEESFQVAMDRCLRLPASRRVLPLSSGYDSRRILAALQSRQAPFEALTLRTIQKGNRDLDAPWAAAMAKDFGFQHRIVELADPRQFAKDDHLGRDLTDSQAATMEHAWIVPLLRNLPRESSLIFDGLGGDIFNTTGYEIRELYACPESEKLSRLSRHHLPPVDIDRNLNRDLWPGIDELRQYFLDYVSDLPEGNNLTDYVFLRLRARHGTGVWSQAVVPAGHVPVHPYFDLDCVRIALRYNPLDKIERFLQDRCLEKFWPQYYAYPGSRRIPADSKPGSPTPLRNIRLACLRQLYSEAGTSPWYRGVRPWLSPRGYAILLAAAHNDTIAAQVQWWMYPLLSLKARERSYAPCWSLRPGN